MRDTVTVVNDAVDLTGTHPQPALTQEPEAGPSWARRASLPGLGSVIDPADVRGTKNAHIDRLQRTALRRALEVRRGTMVVDFGCGIGRLSAWIASRGAVVLGVDSSPEMIEAARRRSPGPRYAVLDDVRIPAPDGAVDAVLSVNVLQYLVADGSLLDRVLADIRRVLRREGMLVLIEQVQSGGMERGARPGVYDAALVRAGFRVTEVRPLRIGGSRLSSVVARLPWLGALPWIGALSTLEARRAMRGGSWSYADTLFRATPLKAPRH